jgi:hypothetical protein
MGLWKNGSSTCLDTSISNWNSQPSNTYPKLYSQQALLKHGMVRLLCTTNVNQGLTPYLILDLAQLDNFIVIYTEGSKSNIPCCAADAHNISKDVREFCT